MAITVKELGEARGWTTSEDGTRVLPRRWVIQSDVPILERAASDALNAFDPTSILYGAHPEWPWAVCRKITGKSSRGQKTWTVDAEYSTRPFAAAGVGSPTGDFGGGGGIGGADKPSPAQTNSQPANQRPPTMQIDQVEMALPLELDVDTGAAVLNPAGDVYDPPVETKQLVDVITWEFFRSAAQLNWPTRRQYRNSINLGDFTLLGYTYPSRQLWCASYGVFPVWETGPTGMTFFWRLVVKAVESPFDWGWDTKLYARGRNQLVALGGGAFARQAIVDRSGQPVAEPVGLKSDGTVRLPADSPFYQTFHGFKAKTWAGLLA